MATSNPYDRNAAATVFNNARTAWWKELEKYGYGRSSKVRERDHHERERA